MNTEDLIDRLSANPRIWRLARPTTRVVLFSALALAVVAGLSIGLLRSSDLASLGSSRHDHGFLLYFAFVTSVAACALVMVRDLSVPARPQSLPNCVLAIPFVLMVLVAGHHQLSSWLHGISPEASEDSWLSCFWQTVGLAVPAFAVLTAGVRSLAPTDLRRAGAYIGMFAGALGAMGHCWHGPAEPFLVGTLLYIAGIGTMMIAGLLLGPRLLRWT
jgi:hypothetical protein